jgi:hypothetical protein
MPNIKETEKEGLPEGISCAEVILPYCMPGDDLKEHLGECCLLHGLLAHAERMENAARQLKEIFMVIAKYPEELRQLTVAKAEDFDIMIIGPDPIIEELVEAELADWLDDEDGGDESEDEDSEDEDDENDPDDKDDENKKQDGLGGMGKN